MLLCMDLYLRLREIALDLLALLWPTECVSCGAPDRDCCEACLSEVREAASVMRLDGEVPGFAGGAYEGPLRAMLVAFKHAGRIGFARELGARLRSPLREAFALCHGPPVIVTAPSRPSRIRERGYRHVEMIVSEALRGQRAPALRVRGLRALPGRTAQLGLGSRERLGNAARVTVRASARTVLRGRETILVDDVMTTGATLLAARRALEREGARVVATVVLCAVERRDTRRDS